MVQAAALSRETASPVEDLAAATERLKETRKRKEREVGVGRQTRGAASPGGLNDLRQECHMHSSVNL
jgi:hypothetical protein